jgi:putative transposase
LLLCELPGYTLPKGATRGEPQLALPDLEKRFREFLLGTYHRREHSDTKVPPQERWNRGGFLPQMPNTLEQLDLLLLTVAKSRRIRPDGIHFLGMRYIDPTLAAYVGEDVVLRYDPRDIAEVRVFYQDRFLCRAICQELAGETVPLREILRARNHNRKELRRTIQDRQRTVDALLEFRRWTPTKEEPPADDLQAAPQPPPLKRYFNE